MDRSDAPLPEIRLIELEKRFRDVVAVDRISLRIETGEFFSLLGPSGCGKTTTLRMIGGFEPPTGGRIELRGRDVTRDARRQAPREHGVPELRAVPASRRCRQCRLRVAPQGRAEGRDPDQGRRSARARAAVGLRAPEAEPAVGRSAAACRARAGAGEPATVLLLDEPLGALDLKLRRQLQVELKRIQAEVGITFVYVTHDQEEALTMSDRIAVMNGGRIEQLGTPEDLYDRPATRFVAGLHRDDQPAQRDGRRPGGRRYDGASRQRRADGDDDERAGRRPARRTVRAARGHHAPVPAPPRRGIAGQIEQVAFLGATIQYLVRTAGGEPLTVLAPKAGGKLPGRRGRRTRWSPDEARVLGGDASGSQEEAPG